jgi:hypothetical protein
MSLFPNKNDILTKEIELWKGFADSLRKDDRNLFIKMLMITSNTLLQLILKVNHFQLNHYS